MSQTTDATGSNAQPAALEPGMVLARDVYTNQDILMLTQGQKLTARHIEKQLALGKGQ